ncbi:hypothetical protein SAMN02910436_02727 [Ruminococcaceae bacterium P7]|nr:hypothetical protein SAMN02910436_02727 [Ruminococcaceae bacterium P7]
MDFEVSQVKEKFGTLRFYFHLAESHTREFTDQLYDIVRLWEERSATVCEKCGNPGEQRTDLP